MSIERRKTREVIIGDVRIGNRQPISVQSMTKTDTKDVTRTVRQIKRLERAGCDIVRVAVKDMPAVEALGRIKRKINNLPLVADIHFHHQLALKAISQGVDAIRLNPGNINKKEEIKKIVNLARKHHIPLRVGVNSGSLSYSARSAYPNGHRLRVRSAYPNGHRYPIGHRLRVKKLPTAQRMINSALKYIKLLEDLDFCDIIISLKASSVVATVEAYRRMAKLCNYPFHLGITATGPQETGNIKSAIAIGSLLLEGIGDTLRVSLTAPPEEEVKAAKEILAALGLRHFGPQIISCPTCARCQVNLIKIVEEVSKRLNDVRCTMYDVRPTKLAIMGCVVNGPGEAKDADLGIACGKRSAILFRKGKKIRKIREENIIKTLLKEVESRK